MAPLNILVEKRKGLTILRKCALAKRIAVAEMSGSHPPSLAKLVAVGTFCCAENAREASRYRRFYTTLGLGGGLRFRHDWDGLGGGFGGIARQPGCRRQDRPFRLLQPHFEAALKTCQYSKKHEYLY